MFTEYPEITGIDNIKVSLNKHHIFSTICYIEQFLRETETVKLQENKMRLQKHTLDFVTKCYFLVKCFFYSAINKISNCGELHSFRKKLLQKIQ